MNALSEDASCNQIFAAWKTEITGCLCVYSDLASVSLLGISYNYSAVKKLAVLWFSCVLQSEYINGDPTPEVSV